MDGQKLGSFSGMASVNCEVKSELNLLLGDPYISVYLQLLYYSLITMTPSHL